MKLSVLERLVAQSLIPKEADFTNLKLIRVAREKLSFDDAEQKTLNFRQESGQMVWNNGVPDQEIDLGETVTSMIVKELKRLDESNKLTMDHLGLYEKFINDKG